MKHKGALMEFSKERLDDLMRVYYEYIASCRHIRMDDVYKCIVNRPSKRFWVSDIRAALVVSAINRGEDCLKEMLPLKREMYMEIYRRVMNMKKKHPDMSVSELCSIVTMQQAPKYYITPGSAKMMICKERKRWIGKKRKMMNLC